MEGSILTESEQELTAEGLGSKDLEFRVIGSRVIGVRVIGFREIGFREIGFRVIASGAGSCCTRNNLRAASRNPQAVF